jgi:allantoicase
VASGRVVGAEIDTAFFDGNHAPEISIQGVFLPGGDDVDAQVSRADFAGWQTVLERQECGPSQRQAWKLASETTDAFTHVRLCMWPDGGIARFKLFGTVQPVFPQDALAVFDLAATVNGGLAVACSDQHFGRIENLLLPGRGKDMGDGWETKRTRGVHVDWAVIKLGAPGTIDRLLIDTAHFRGNFPKEVQVFAAPKSLTGLSPRGTDEKAWTEVLAPVKSSADVEHEYKEELQNVEGKVYAYVKLVIIPDGGVKRIRVFGRREA